MNFQVEEAMIRDDLDLFKKLQLNPFQIKDFVYQVSGPKSQAMTFRESESKSAATSTIDTSFYLNYNMLMLACHFEAIKILEYLYDDVILR